MAAASVLRVHEADMPRRAPAAILFAEIRGFTGMSDMLEPAAVIARVRDFFALAGTAAGGRHGSLVNGLNDTAIALFEGPERCRGALLAAQEIQREFAGMAQGWERDYGIRAAVAMGLHCGEAVIGVVPPAADRVHVFGDCVSVAERLLHRARSGEYVLSEAMMAQLAGADFGQEPEMLPAIEIPRRPPIRVWGVLLDTRLDFT